MARGRTFRWVDASGNSLLLSDRANGFEVLQGVTGLGMPGYAVDKEDLPQDGTLVRGVRATGRTIFLPMNVFSATRNNFLLKKQNLAYMMDPTRGPGYLYIFDGGKSYRIKGYYSDGLTGDESSDAAGEEGLLSWSKFGLTFDCDPYFEQLYVMGIGPYGYDTGVPFFPILPVRLGTSQVLSDASQPVVTNKIRNPSFELNTTAGWSTAFYTTPVVTATPTTMFSDVGSYSARVDFPPAVNGSSGAFFTTGDSAALVSGQRYTIRARVYVPTGQPPVHIGSWDSASAYSQTNDAWETLYTTFTVSTTGPLLTLQQSGVNNANADGGYCFIDDAMLINGPLVDYIDGDQPNCHWTGTPHQSTSYRDATYAPTIVNNPGTQDSWPVITVVGPGTYLDLVKRSTGEHVTLNYTIGINEVITIDMKNKSVMSNNGTNLFRYLVSDDFWSLDHGDNNVTFSLSGAAAGSTISGTFTPRFDSIV